MNEARGEPQRGPGRTHAELMALIADDLTINIFKHFIEAAFGGLWLFLLFTVGAGLKDIIEIVMRGGIAPKERKAMGYLEDRSVQLSLVFFFTVVSGITVILLLTERGRSVLSSGTVVFIVGWMIYSVFWKKSSKPLLEYEEKVQEKAPAAKKGVSESTEAKTKSE